MSVMCPVEVFVSVGGFLVFFFFKARAVPSKVLVTGPGDGDFSSIFLLKAEKF